MKPDWKDAPEWANWLAKDKDGEWYYYEYKPDIQNQPVPSKWTAVHAGRMQLAAHYVNDWRESLEQRP